MADPESNYYRGPLDGADFQSAVSGRWFRIGAAFFGGSCLVLLPIVITSTSTRSIQNGTASDSTSVFSLTSSMTGLARSTDPNNANVFGKVYIPPSRQRSVYSLFNKLDPQGFQSVLKTSIPAVKRAGAPATGRPSLPKKGPAKDPAQKETQTTGLFNFGFNTAGKQSPEPKASPPKRKAKGTKEESPQGLFNFNFNTAEKQSPGPKASQPKRKAKVTTENPPQGLFSFNFNAAEEQDPKPKVSPPKKQATVSKSEPKRAPQRPARAPKARPKQSSEAKGPQTQGFFSFGNEQQDANKKKAPPAVAKQRQSTVAEKPPPVEAKPPEPPEGPLSRTIRSYTTKDFFGYKVFPSFDQVLKGFTGDNVGGLIVDANSNLWPSRRFVFSPFDDVVVGGSSRSSFDAKSGEWTGIVGESSEAGQFAGIRTKTFEPPLDLTRSSGIQLKVKGKGERFKFGLRDSGDYEGIVWEYSFDTSPWFDTEVMIDFRQLIPTKDGKVVLPPPIFNLRSIYAVQFTYSKLDFKGDVDRPNPKFKAGQFELTIKEIATAESA